MLNFTLAHGRHLSGTGSFWMKYYPRHSHHQLPKNLIMTRRLKYRHPPKTHPEAKIHLSWVFTTKILSSSFAGRQKRNDSFSAALLADYLRQSGQGSGNVQWLAREEGRGGDWPKIDGSYQCWLWVERHQPGLPLPGIKNCWVGGNALFFLSFSIIQRQTKHVSSSLISASVWVN